MSVVHPKGMGARPERYENEEVIKWILDPMRLRAMFPWWPQFEKQQENWRQLYRDRALIATHTKQLSMTKSGEFGLHWFRIPTRIDEILLKLDPELDGRNPRKMERFLRDFPVFDLRQRG